MALLTWAIQAEDAPAHIGRLISSVLLREGVVDIAGDAFVVAEDTGSNMQVVVGSGVVGDLCVIEGDSAAGQGVYIAESQDATVTLPISASDPSDDRIDLVVARVYDDSEDSSGSSETVIEIVEGTPASSPAAPATPDSAIVLASILVQASVTAITNGDITDARVPVKARGELVETIYYTASGTFDKADYPWLRKVLVKAQGAGGQAGGAPSTSAGEASGGGGGGAGDYVEQWIDVSDLASSETVTVGAGGSGASVGGTGNGGGETSFGSHCAAAGGGGGSNGGPVAAPYTGGAVGGIGGAGSGTSSGDLIVRGGGGTNAWPATTINPRGGRGGDARMGGGQQPANSNNSNGVAAAGFGGGGSGAANGASQPSHAGGAGAPGIVVVELYA